MIIRGFLTAIAAGLLAIGSQVSFAQSPAPTQATGNVEHAYQGGPKTVVPHGTVGRAKTGGAYGLWTGARAESPEFAPAASINPHRYYGGPKYH